ncbi:efflux RND transporter periplasmic adaptor subunit [Terriglobus saanensis]|uniref:Efflux transporter, RND family, MFP subunit n=1 Tax=Terriglobus saanensis (strain ATCC BAA-1853 / DSM 23119 / SP1PR4) TaxID=401053 RepID=E8V1Y2_TERSS|nr:efflux RND transporter periplasmic adaptor subunit [Terriglobus saanensis]ADV83470.1 efflux transporter, RND family, MFP subunit [Terriglobus saanensis SP1PR4]
MPTPKSVRLALALPLFACVAAQSQTAAHIEMTKVESRSASRTIPLTAELQPYLQTDIEARVPGYVVKMLVDRGSVVHRGQLLVQLSAPEMSAQTNATDSALHQAEAEVAQAQAQAAAAASMYARLQEAAKTPGAVAGNELEQAEKQKEAAASLVESRRAAVRSAKSKLQATKDMESYLNVIAPFDGTITDRFVHPGIMVDAGGHTPLLKLQQISHLRLVVPVPESYVGSIAKGRSVTFHVPARPGKSYSGKIARVPNALDQQNRTMMAELDVFNTDKTLAPGMYPTVDWPVGSNDNALYVPITSVVTTTERTFVITVVNGRAHWVNVRKGATAGEQVAIRGEVSDGQAVVKRATDEIREGSAI